MHGRGGHSEVKGEVEDKGKRELRQAAADRAKKKRNGIDEGESGGGEEYVVAPSSGKRGRISGSVNDRNKVVFKISQAIAKSGRGVSSSNRENGLKRNSYGRTTKAKQRPPLQAQGRG